MLAWGGREFSRPSRYLRAGRWFVWIPRRALGISAVIADDGFRDPKRQQTIERVDQTGHALTGDEGGTPRCGFPTLRANRFDEASMG
jgi:hypothetical protein